MLAKAITNFKNFINMDENIKFTSELYSNLDSKKEHRDKDDCTVRAFSLVMGCSYDKARMFMAANGRNHREGMSFGQLRNIFDNLKKHKATILCPDVSVAKFAKNNLSGRYYIIIEQHALAVIDGVIHDWDTSSKNKKILCAWKVDLSSEE
jgi:hypothetical protein